MTNLSKGVPIPYALARKDDSNPNQFMVVYTQSYGFVEGRDVGILNRSTSSTDTYRLTPDGHPLIWFNSDIDDYEYMTDAGMLNALLEADPPIARRTGETRTLQTADGAKCMEPEVEILVDEGELARVCCYCGALERVEYCRYERCGGDAIHPLYMCFVVCVLSSYSSHATHRLRRL